MDNKECIARSYCMIKNILENDHSSDVLAPNGIERKDIELIYSELEELVEEYGINNIDLDFNCEYWYMVDDALKLIRESIGHIDNMNYIYKLDNTITILDNRYGD